MKNIKEKRHKCHLCGAVRYESNMRKLAHTEVRVKPQFGNDEKCWACRNGCRAAFGRFK